MGKFPYAEMWEGKEKAESEKKKGDRMSAASLAL